MPDTNYTIVIKNETDGQSSTPVSTEGGGKTNAGNPAVATEQAEASAKGQGFATAMVAVQQISPWVQKVANFGISQVGFQTGSDSLQRKMEAVSGIATSIGSIAIATAINPVAGAVSAVMSLLNSLTSTIENSVNISNQKTLETESIGLKRSRLGIATNHSRGGYQ